MSDNEYIIKVKHLTEKTYEVKVTSDTTVEQLKEKLEVTTKFAPDKMKLIFKGKILKTKDDKMSDLKCTEGCTLHLIINKPQPESAPTNQNQGTPNVNPFSNTQNTGQGFNNQNPNPFGGLGGFGGMPGMQGMQGMPGMPGMQGMQGMQGVDPNMMNQFMQNPQARAMAQQLLSDPEQLRNMINSNPMLQQMAQNNPQLQAMLDNPQMMQMVSGMLDNPQAMQGMQGMPGMGNMPQPGQQPQPNTQAQPNQQSQPGQPQPNQQTQPNPQAPPPMPNLSNMMNNPQMMQQMQQMGFNPGMFQQPQQQSQNPEEEYKEQLQKLEEMGFTNKQLNIQVLKQTFGNVDAAVEKLLSMF